MSLHDSSPIIPTARRLRVYKSLGFGGIENYGIMGKMVCKLAEYLRSSKGIPDFHLDQNNLVYPPKHTVQIILFLSY